MPRTVTHNKAVGSDGAADEATEEPTCFVIQPFDRSKFDKRFRDAFKPALRDAGLRAYRVDEDPAPDVLIDAIEDGIRSALMVLADVTADNPNVWYELGYAFALNMPVILTCEEDRRLPFDIQHRHVIQYQSESGSDFDKLKRQITDRARALRKGAVERQVHDADPIPPQDGLTQREIHLLGVLAGATSMPGSSQNVWSLSRNAESGGLTKVAVGLALRELTSRGFVHIEELEDDQDGYSYKAAHVSDTGWKWIKRHDHLFIRQVARDEDISEFEDDIPF